MNIRRALHALAQLVKDSPPGPSGLVIQPYRGYGSLEKIFLMGRVFKESVFATREGTLSRDLTNIGQRLFRRGVANVVLVARFGETEQQVITDEDGYFRVHLHPLQPPPIDRRWHSMALKSIQPAGAVAEGDFFVPPNTARYIVISDIDDTVMYTGVANKVKMLWRMFVQEAESRVAFPGIAAFYRALHCGVSGSECNPMLYVSRGSWSLYEVLSEFFHLHDIPVGPILFLRHWGVTLRHPFSRRAKGHKLALIRDILALYDDRPVVLVGDSGQRDPEVYAQVVHEHPGRIRAIYIRNVSRDQERHREIETLANEVISAGSTLLLAADSFAMAEHAIEHNLISPAALAEVLREREQQQEVSNLKPSCKERQATLPDTQKSSEYEGLEETLEQESEEGLLPTIVVESEENRER